MMLCPTKLERLARRWHFCLLGLFISYEENSVLDTTTGTGIIALHFHRNLCMDQIR
jgi:hypothetical protein